MPLIDGTYEILEQRPTGDGRTLVRATDPDGRPVRIVWYDVPAEAEASFEHYRRVLRRLARDPDVLLREVVSRPGARYAVWDDPADATPSIADGAWRARLDGHGLDPDQADLRRRGRELVLAGLDWSEDAAPEPLPSAEGADPKPREPLRLPSLGPAGRAWTATALLLLSSAAFLLAGWLRYANDGAAMVPDVVGATVDDAARQLVRSGFAPELRAVAGDGTPLSVVATDPEPSAALRPGRTVRVDYLRPRQGAADRQAPALAGRSLGEAQARIDEAGLRLGAVSRVPASTPPGTVLAQRPAGGARLASNDAVDLLVSDGPRPAETFLPDLVGLPLGEARALARLAGLPADRVLVDPVVADGVPAGRIVAMTPAPWHPLRVDEVTVRLLVSDPDGSVRADPDASVGGGTPDVTGLDLGDARQRAAAAGAGVGVRTVSRRDLPDGVVLQDPAPGQPLGETLSLVVNARPRSLPVPDPQVRIQAPRLRWIPYRFLIEPGIPEQTAELRATNAEGDSALVLSRQVIGGDVLEGVWPTVVPGPVTFELRLNGVPYAEARVTTEVERP